MLFLFFCYEFHIHAWNMAQGWLAEIKDWFSQSMVRWFVEVPNSVGLYID